MDEKVTEAGVREFLTNNDPIQGEIEYSKLHDYFLVDSGDLVDRKTSILGGMFIRFKKLLQEKSLITGMKNCLKRSDWKDEPVYGAFWDDYKVFDGLSNYYGNQYRGSFIFNYLMGAFAVLVALVPVGFAFEHNLGHVAHYYELLFTGVELIVILAILLIYQVGANPHGHNTGRSFLGIRLNRRWHEKWIEYRLLAERFRYMEILYPIGINPLIEGAARENDIDDWVNAYYAMRLKQVKTECTDDIAAYKARLLKVMEGQSSYHDDNAGRSERIHHRLHTFATWMFYGTLAACASHFIWHNPILTLAAGFLPAVAAAMHGILASGEFSKIAEVSERMHHQIANLMLRLKYTTDKDEIRSIAMDFHNIVIGEALNWKSIFRAKNVPLA